MAVTAEPKTATDLGLTIEGVNHFTIPVRDHDKSRQFYVSLLGGVVRREADWTNVRAGRSRSAAMAVRMCEGMELDLFYQPFGMPAPDQEHPHFSFWVQTAGELDAYKAALETTGVPTALVTGAEAPKLGDDVEVQLRFNDPDGNHLSIDCRHYPFRQGINVGGYDPWDLTYDFRAWPRS